MAEAIGSRVKRIITGSINALIDAAEGVNPQIVMQQSIREVDGVITQIRHEMGKVVVEKKHLEKQIDELKTKHNALLEQIKIALKEDREDLAKAGTLKQINIEEQLPVLKSSLSNASEEIVKYEEYIKALNAKKRDMEDELKMLKSKVSSPINENENSINAATQAFERVMGTSSLNTDTQELSKLNELEELSRNKQVEDRLKELKDSLNV